MTREERRAYARKYYAANRKRVLAYTGQSKSARRNRTLRHFGLTHEEFTALLKIQGGVCAICKRPEVTIGRGGKVRSLSVDHNHSTGVIRGILCYKCNTGLGNFRDDPAILSIALEYLTSRGV